MQALQIRFRLDVSKILFWNWVVDEWNNLPSNITESTAVIQFKNRIDDHFKKHDRLYITSQLQWGLIRVTVMRFVISNKSIRHALWIYFQLSCFHYQTYSNLINRGYSKHSIKDLEYENFKGLVLGKHRCTKLIACFMIFQVSYKYRYCWQFTRF